MLSRIILCVVVCTACGLRADAQGAPTRNTTPDRLMEEDLFSARLPALLPLHERYQHKEFMAGTVYFFNRHKTEVTHINYDILFRQMVAINEKGDTAFVPDFEKIKYVEMDGALYYHQFQKGYYRILTDPSEPVKLGVRKGLMILDSRLLGDHEEPALVSTSNYFSVLYSPVNTTYYRQEITLARQYAYVLVDNDGQLHPASRAGFMELFPRYTNGINGYIRQLAKQKTPLHYWREEDLKTLLKFCLSLK